jgi:hypothetical protein
MGGLPNFRPPLADILNASMQDSINTIILFYQTLLYEWHTD